MPSLDPQPTPGRVLTSKVVLDRGVVLALLRGYTTNQGVTEHYTGNPVIEATRAALWPAEGLRTCPCGRNDWVADTDDHSICRGCGGRHPDAPPMIAPARTPSADGSQPHDDGAQRPVQP